MSDLTDGLNPCPHCRKTPMTRGSANAHEIKHACAGTITVNVHGVTGNRDFVVERWNAWVLEAERMPVGREAAVL